MKETIGVVPEDNWKSWDFGPHYKNARVIQKKVGQGRIVVSPTIMRYMREYGDAADQIEEIIRQAAPQLARSKGDVFEFFRRVAPDGTKYLGVLNRNPDADMTAAITLRGEYKRVMDIDIPGGFPAAVKVGNGRTRLRLRLQPAGMTVLRMDR